MGDADSDAKKQALFERVRNGSIRVLIGSTQKMGTGTNVQKRLAALHHLDAPWKPAEVEQREGRILRQGNENKQVAIYRYVTEGSFDAYMWQALETKARFISQIMTGESAVRRAEDIGGQEMSYAEVKAIASGNPAVLTLAEADAELQRLSILKKNHDDGQYIARKNVKTLPQTIERLTGRLKDITQDLATSRAHASDAIMIGNRPCPRDQVTGVLGKLLDGLPQAVREPKRVPLGTYRGLSFGIVLHTHTAPEIYLEGAATRHTPLSSEHSGPRAVLNALDRLIGTYPNQIESTRQELAIAEGQQRDYEARIGAPFPHDDYLRELSRLRDALKLGLSANAPTEGMPTTADIAEQIKRLRAANTIESAPQRLATRTGVRAETPVTTRIRQRHGHQEEQEDPSPQPHGTHELLTEKEPDHGPVILTIQPQRSTTMSRKKTTTTEAHETTEATAQTPQHDTPEPTTIASLPDDKPNVARYAADPRPWHTVSLSDVNGGPKMELRRSYKYKQLQIAFEGQQPDEQHLARLHEAGWKDRTETEGVWTKQVTPGEWKPVYDAERLFLDIANDIRKGKGLSDIKPMAQGAAREAV